MKRYQKEKWEKNINQSEQQQPSKLSLHQSQEPTTSHHSRQQSSAQEQPQHSNVYNSNFTCPQQFQQYFNTQATQYQPHNYDMLQFHYNVHSDKRHHSLLSSIPRSILSPYAQINPHLHPQQQASQLVFRPTALYASMRSQEASHLVLRPTDFHASLRPQQASQPVFRPKAVYASLRSQPDLRLTDIHASLRPQQVLRPSAVYASLGQKAIVMHGQRCSTQKIPDRLSIASPNKLSSDDLELNETVKQRRTELKLSQADLAKEINELSINEISHCTKQHISQFERGVCNEKVRMILEPLLKIWIKNNKGRIGKSVEKELN